MKVGDLVRYGSWWNGKPAVGMIIEEDNSPMMGDKAFLVIWYDDDRIEWECDDEIELLPKK